MDVLERSVLETVQQHHMVEPGQHVVVGFSGGADSTCLLAVLRALREELGVTFSAVHVHHGLRESADRDEGFCRDLCAAWGIPLIVVHADAARYAAEHGESVEEAGRSIRYAAFRRELAAHGGGRIATAHHREDLAETVLLNLCRGSGIAGLSGIRPVYEEIIRPLLAATRAQIEEYLTRRGIAWREDETNADIGYTRNYLRLQTIPGLMNHVNPGTIHHLARLAGEAAETEAFLEQEADAARMRCLVDDTEGGTRAISVQALLREPRILQRRVVLEMICEAAGQRKDIASVHVQAVLSICNVPDGGTQSVDLPYGLRAVRTYDVLTISRGMDGPARWTGTYRMRVFCREELGAAIPCEVYTKWLDYDRIGTFPILRTRRNGDGITIGGGVRKSLHRFMIDEKVPRDLRDTMEIPFAGSEALWIPGHQINAAFKVREDTSHILVITYSAGPDASGARQY